MIFQLYMKCKYEKEIQWYDDKSINEEDTKYSEFFTNLYL